MVRHTKLLVTLLLLIIASACGSDSSGAAADGDDTPATAPATVVNAPIDPPIVVDGAAGPATLTMPVHASRPAPSGRGATDAFVDAVIVDGDDVFVDLSHSTGCGSFDHFALVETDTTGVYDLFYDTDNNCEALGYATLQVTGEISRADDGSVTVRSTNGAEISSGA